MPVLSFFDNEGDDDVSGGQKSSWCSITSGTVNFVVVVVVADDAAGNDDGLIPAMTFAVWTVLLQCIAEREKSVGMIYLFGI